MWICGCNNEGQLAQGNNNQLSTFQVIKLDFPIQQVLEISSGFYHFAILANDIYTVGSNGNGQLCIGKKENKN